MVSLIRRGTLITPNYYSFFDCGRLSLLRGIFGSRSSNDGSVATCVEIKV